MTGVLRSKAKRWFLAWRFQHLQFRTMHWKHWLLRCLVPNDALEALAVEAPAPAVPNEPFSALEHDANMTENVDGHLVVAEQCDSTQLQQKSTSAGKGLNAFVIRLTNPVCGGKKGEVLKGFNSASQRDYASGLLAALPSSTSNILAGLACKANAANDCKVESKCVNSVGKFAANADCFYVRMKYGGSKTLEQCFAEPNREAKSIKFLMMGVVKVLQLIHKSNFFHSDFQLKNLMVDDTCNSAKLQVVDLDGMRNASTVGKQTGEPFCAAHEAWKDYMQLFGACHEDYGYPKLENLVKNTAAKLMAQALREAADSALDCSSNPWDKSWAEITSMQNGPGAKFLAAAKDLK